MRRLKFSYVCAFSLLHVDEPHRFQSRQRFSDRRAADLKTLRKRLNGIKLFTRLKLARFYLLQQCVSDFLVDFFVLICLYFNAITPSLVNLDVYRLLYFFFAPPTGSDNLFKKSIVLSKLSKYNAN